MLVHQWCSHAIADRVIPALSQQIPALLLPGFIQCTRPIILHVLMLKLSTQHSDPGHLLSLCWKMCLTGEAKSTCQPFRQLLLMFSYAYHISIDFIGQDGNTMFGGHWGDTDTSTINLQSICDDEGPERNGSVSTFEDLLYVFFGKDRSTGVGRVGNNQTGCPLINQALQVLEVNCPRFLWLQTWIIVFWCYRLFMKKAF